MAKSNRNLNDIFQDTANAIRSKAGTSSTINPRDFADEITNLPSGEDTGADILNKTISVANYSSVTRIYTYAFCSCYQLTEANFPNCSQISGYAFAYCSQLSSISFSKCEFIGGYAFQSCYQLTEANFPLCTNIGNYAFQNCSQLTEANFPNCLSVGDNAFQNCSQLTEANFTNCLSIRPSAFHVCFQLSSISSPLCLTIGNGAFQNCSLTEANFPNCSYFNNSVFRTCTRLTRANIYCCTNLTQYVFDACSPLSEVYIMNMSSTSVTYLQNINTFRNTPISTSGYLGYYGSIYVHPDRLASFKAATNWITYSDRIVAAPQSVVDLGVWPYEYYQSTLTEVPSEKANVELIGQYAFYSCSQLSTVSFSNCKYIGFSAFYSCSQLAQAYFLNSVVVALVDSTAFQATPMSDSSYLGYYGSIYVRASLLSLYQNANNWSAYSDRLVGLTDEETAQLE